MISEASLTSLTMKADIYHNEDWAQTTVKRKFRKRCRISLNEYHEKLIESVAELDEDLMEKYFGGEELTIDEIKSTIRKATID